MKKYKILLFSPDLGAHQTKKIKTGFLAAGNVESVEVAGFKRRYESDIPKEYKVVSQIGYANKAGRIGAMLYGIARLAPLLKGKDIAYSWGLFSVLILILAKFLSGNWRLKIIYNLRDANNMALGPSIFARMLRLLDRFAVGKSDLLLTTSPYFISEYFQKVVGITPKKWYFLGNKVPEYLWENIDASAADSDRESEPITYGIFGRVTKYHPFGMMEKLRGSGVRFYIRGTLYMDKDFMDDFLSRNPHVEYGGKYKNPDDLCKMFSKCDISLKLEDIPLPDYPSNYTWALSNRFYEAMFFKKPFFTFDSYGDANLVEKFGVGLAIKRGDADSEADILKSVSRTDIKKWVKNIEKLDRSEYVLEKNEYAKMIDFMLY